MFGPFSGFMNTARMMDAWLIDQKNEQRRQRRLEESDIEGFMQASGQRRGPMSDAQLLERLMNVNNYRVWRLQRDMKWARKQLVKMGVDPSRAKDIV